MEKMMRCLTEGPPSPKGPSGANAELSDLLFSGFAERPMWASFLSRLAARMGGGTSAFLISSGQHGIAEGAVLAPAGMNNDFIPLVNLHDLANLPFEEPILLDGQEPALAGWEGTAIIRLHLDVNRSIWLATRPAREGALLADDWHHVLLELTPLLKRIAPLYLVFGDTERRRLIAEYVLETSGIGVILVDAAGSVINTNAAAHAIMDNSKVLEIKNGRLHARRQADQKLLLGHIARKAADQTPEGLSNCHAAMALLRDENMMPVTVIVRPGPPYGPVSAPLRRTATVILRDPAQRLRLAGADLEHLFKLSPAEARLACLLGDGLGTEEAAFELGVSRHTVRSQLQSIYAKTGANRQGELVRMLLSSAAALAQADVQERGEP